MKASCQAGSRVRAAWAAVAAHGQDPRPGAASSAGQGGRREPLCARAQSYARWLIGLR